MKDLGRGLESSGEGILGEEEIVGANRAHRADLYARPTRSKIRRQGHDGEVLVVREQSPSRVERLQERGRGSVPGHDRQDPVAGALGQRGEREKRKEDEGDSGEKGAEGPKTACTPSRIDRHDAPPASGHERATESLRFHDLGLSSRNG
jgi:hypothetical protein